MNERVFTNEHSTLRKLIQLFLFRPKILLYIFLLSWFISPVLESNISYFYQIFYIPVGFFFFSILEYATHRWVFHGPVPKNKYLYTLCYYQHLGHHDEPKNIHFIFAPIYVILPVFALISYLLYSISSDIVFNSLFLFGLLSGYIFYEWSHFIIHSPYKLKNKFMVKAQDLHMLHHFRNEKHWLAVAVTTVFMDALCGTSGKKDDVPISKTARLGGVLKDDPRIKFARKVKARIPYV